MWLRKATDMNGDTSDSFGTDTPTTTVENTTTITETSDKKVPITLYDADDLKAMNDEQLLEILKQSWGYESDEDIELFGILKKIKTKNSSFYVLSNLQNNKKQYIFYPISNFKGDGAVFVGHPDKSFTNNSVVKAKVRLADVIFREKHNNPFKLNAVLESMTKLFKLPDELIKEGIDFDSGHIEQWIIDHTSSIHAEKIKQRAEKTIEDTLEKKKELESTLLETQKKLEDVEIQFSKNIDYIRKQDTIIINKKQEISTHQKLFEEAKLELKEIYESKEDIVSKLNKFIETKATLLKDLGILDEQSVREITGIFNEAKDSREGYKPNQDFENVPQAIAHIQAYLYNKGIMYRRSVLENFFTLLSTRDLIILAGDSGSGKTNLVKSFADAIGGKSIIIPVKPNWTGSEDLLGYYNPIEQSFLSTLFLDSLIEAKNNPKVPYFICLDEMNLARVEYYFADFLSLLEERDRQPEIHLYSQSESSHLISETKNFLALLDEARESLNKEDLNSFVEVLQDEELNRKLHELCGFKDGDSLLKYHTRLRKAFASYLNNPAIIEIPDNVFFIGAINIDETTHYLSPKILDRAHIMRFTNPLLQDCPLCHTSCLIF